LIICGLKLTHDGAVALLDGDELVFSVEMEKLANGRRYSTVEDLDVVPRVLADFGYAAGDVDEWVIDGWDGDVPGPVSLLDHGDPVDITVGPYRESATSPDIFRPSVAAEFRIGAQALPYTSYSHAAGHVASVYASSPFAARGESSYVLIWDGGLFPRLYLVGPEHGAVNCGELFPLIGHTYATAAHHFGPFRRDSQSPTVDDLTVAGKLMAYIALGKPQEPVLEILRETFHQRFEDDSERAVRYRAQVGGFGSMFEPSMPPLHDFFGAVAAEVERIGVSDEDVLASVHQFLQDLLVERITAKVAGLPGESTRNLCFGGGCALNIKWNSALRALRLFDDVWVPPFPNDSGSAIGAATLGRIRHEGVGPISWDTRLGPKLAETPAAPDGWSATSCDAAQLARELHETGAPVVVLNGRAELGPRALGGRSILAAATSPGMKDELNRIKGREYYRPVAPICLTDRAPEIFAPGTPDPHMLFDHEVRPQWTRRIPAVVHLDGTARLQTVAVDDDPFLHEVLSEYHALSGIPVLCNTSANMNGRGFFPDVASAAQWGRVDRIWSAGRLYRRLPG
jgi:carbamoyltransferase